ncbi:DUF3419 family protein [Candidatus Pacearchaeota archaeon]|nr:DUF3419 family protein [Candidatus Pacearchaeota archaeon]
MDQKSELAYSCSNENLSGIVLGLDLTPNDSVLAVGGSGDQAFAFLEFVRKVKIVDINPIQIEFIRQKAQSLRIGNNDEFLRVDGNGVADGFIYGEYNPDLRKFDNIRKRKYFAEDDPKRLRRIQANLDNLIISDPMDIIELAQREKGFNKIYLSNAFGYKSYSHVFNVSQILENIARNLPLDGLVYVANHDLISDIFYQYRYGLSKVEDTKNLCSVLRKFHYSNVLDELIDCNMDLLKSSFLPPELKVDRELSLKVRRIEGGIWKPAIYRKVEIKTLWES